MYLERGLWRESCGLKYSRHSWDPPAKNWEWDALQQVSPRVQSTSSSVSHISFPISVIHAFRDPKIYWWKRSMRGSLGKGKASASWVCRHPQPNIYQSFRSVAGFPVKDCKKVVPSNAFLVCFFYTKELCWCVLQARSNKGCGCTEVKYCSI